MIYNNIFPGRFISRPNRFIAHIEIEGSTEICHVKNTGRCAELLIPGAHVFVQKSDNANRKTRFDLISVYKGDRLINMDSQAPNKVFAQWAQSSGYFQNISCIRPEVKYENSRFDFYIEADSRRIFVEVKGVTLEDKGICMFPDAPTVRGVKHLLELCDSIRHGYSAMIVFIIQMDGVSYFTPNDKTHPQFKAALAQAVSCGVTAVALDCCVTENSITAKDFVEIRF